MSKPHRIPPSPEVMANLFMEYRRSGKAKKMTFKQYLQSIGFVDPAAEIDGMDDAMRFRRGAAGAERIDIPAQTVKGTLLVKELLIDFPDRQGALPAGTKRTCYSRRSNIPPAACAIFTRR